MAQISEIFGIGLQARIELERGGTGTIAELLRIRMDDVDRSIMRRKSLKERLGFKGIVCCGGATWGISSTTVSVMDEDEENTTGPLGPEIEPINNDTLSPIENGPASPCVQRSPATTGMNLATALAAERQFRASLDSGSPSPQRPNSNEESSGPSPQRPNSNAESANGEGTVPGTPARVSLLKLLEEADGNYGRDKKEDDMEGNMVCDSMCCVCMGRKKGAAFIPCGHTFCRVCSRELWLNRGSCPLCNRLILEILDIY